VSLTWLFVISRFLVSRLDVSRLLVSRLDISRLATPGRSLGRR
jgi:hypothetical protein